MIWWTIICCTLLCQPLRGPLQDVCQQRSEIDICNKCWTETALHIEVIVSKKVQSHTISTKMYVAIADPNQHCLASITDFAHLCHITYTLPSYLFPPTPATHPPSMWNVIGEDDTVTRWRIENLGVVLQKMCQFLITVLNPRWDGKETYHLRPPTWPPNLVGHLGARRPGLGNCDWAWYTNRARPPTKVQTKFQPKVMGWSKVTASRIGIRGVGTSISCHRLTCRGYFSTISSSIRDFWDSFWSPDAGRLFVMLLDGCGLTTLFYALRKAQLLFGSAMLATVAVHDTAMLSVWKLTEYFLLFSPSFWEVFLDFIHSSLIALQVIISNHPISVSLIVRFFGGAISVL
jgi:hypothetical protein